MEATTYFDQGYEDQLEKLGFNVKGMASSVGNFFKTQVGGRARQFGQNVRDETKGLLNRPVHPKQYSVLSGDTTSPELMRSALTTDTAGAGTSGIRHLSGAGLEQRVSGALKDMDMRKARGDELFKRTYIPRNHSALKVSGEYRPAPRTVRPYPGAQPLSQQPVTQKGWVNPPPGQAPQVGWRNPPPGQVQHSAVMPFRPTAVSQPPPQMAVNQDMLSTRVASEVDMNYYEQGYADRLVQLGLYKDAGLKDLAGKVRDLGSRALGKSKATVAARRANITSGRQAVTAAKDEKMLQGVRDKYKTKVDEIKGTQPSSGEKYTPPPELQELLDKYKPGTTTPPGPTPPPAIPTPPAGTEAEGPGNWEKFKGWWGERKPWQQVGMGAAVAAPVAAGLYMAGKDNPPSLAQQQMGYTPQY